MDFEIVETGFSSADETINFGTRCFGDVTNLYEATTVVCMRTENDAVPSDVTICSLINNGKIFCSINKTLKIFADKECSSVFSAGVENPIDVIQVSPDGKYSWICMEGGEVLVMESSTSGVKSIFSKNIIDTEIPCRVNFMRCFIEYSDPNNKYSVIIVTTVGRIYRLSVTHSQEGETNVEVELLQNFMKNLKATSYSFPYLMLNFTDNLVVLNTITQGIAYGEFYDCRTICSLPYFLLGLDAAGKIVRIFPDNLLTFPLNFDCLFSTISVSTDNNGNFNILGVTVPDDQGKTYLKMFTYPDLSEIYSIKLSSDISIIQAESILDETMYIVKEIAKDRVGQVRIVQVSETEPGRRLDRLIRKNRFDEAEQIVKMFHLDPVLIAKAKAKLIIEKTAVTTDDINNLISLLDSITNDDLFKLTICVSMANDSYCEDRDNIRIILNYGCSLIPKSHDDEEAEEIDRLQQKLTEMLFKFDTFVAVFPENTNSDAWITFWECDLLKEIESYIKQYKIEESIILYNRLDEVTTREISTEFVETILSYFNDLPEKIYQSFLPTFIPLTLSYNPSSLPCFVRWLYQKVLYMERDIKKFPEKALEFAETVMKLFRASQETNLVFQRQTILNKDCLNEIDQLIKALHGLQRFKISGINIRLGDYMKGPNSVIKFFLNIMMLGTITDYDKFLKNVFFKYLEDNNLEPDSVLLEGIKSLTKYNEKAWSKLLEPVLNYISFKSTKIEAIRFILNIAQIPWSDKIRKVAQDAVELNDPQIIELIRNEPRRLVLRKHSYAMKEKLVSIKIDPHLEFLTKKIVRVGEPTMVEDVYTLCKSPMERKRANSVMIPVLIRLGKFEEALKILDENTPEEIYNTSKIIGGFIKSQLSNTSKLNIMYRDNYYEIASPIYTRLIQNGPKPLQKHYAEELKLIQQVHNLNKEFNSHVQVEDMIYESEKERVREEILENLIMNYENMSTVLSKCEKLASYLSMDKNDVILLACEKLRNMNLIVEAGEYMLETEASVKHLCLCSILIFKTIGVDNFNLSLGTTLMDDTNLSDNMLEPSSDLFLSGLKLAREMAIKAMLIAEDEDKLATIEVYNFVSSYIYLTCPARSQVMKRLFKEMLIEPYVVPGYNTFTSIKKVFEEFTRYLATLNNPVHKYLVHSVTEGPLPGPQFLKYLEQHHSTIDNLCREGHYMGALHIIDTLQNATLRTDLTAQLYWELDDILCENCMPKLLQTVTSAPSLDVRLLYSLLTRVKTNYAVKILEVSLRRYRKTPTKLLDLTFVSLRLFKAKKMNVNNSPLYEALLIIKWWNKFSKSIGSMSYETFIKLNYDDRLEHFIKLDILDHNFIGEYCSDYSMSVQKYYAKYLKQHLLGWKPKYDIDVDVCNRRSLILRNNESDLIELCTKIINKVTDKNSIIKILTEIWDKVNFYHYEVLICILTTISKIKNKMDSLTEQQLHILAFLKNYKRYSSPSQSEIEQWYTVFPDVQSIDPLSEFRLPFSPSLFTGDIWNIIRPEVNLKTYEHWFCAISVLKNNLSMDDICLFVIKEVTSSGILGNNTDPEWQMTPRHQDLLAEVDRCISHISDLEKKASAIYNLMIYMPKGADQVAAAEMCYRCAVEYKQTQPDTANEKAFIKVEKKYFSLSATHILHKYALNEPEYLELVSKPEELIMALYMDKRIVGKADCVNVKCPDINAAVDELSAFFQLNVNQIRHSLLDSWLMGSENVVDMDFTITGSASTDASFFTKTDASLKRAAYLCTSGTNVYWQTFLYAKGTDDQTMKDKQNLQYGARALKCLCAISDKESLLSLTEATYEELMFHVDKLTLLSQLELFGFTLDMNEIDNYNKKELLKRVSVENNNPRAISVMAAICIIYAIGDLKYWKFIVTAAIKLDMYKDLKMYLDFLKNKKCQYKNFYVIAWQKLIEHSFNTRNLSSDETDEAYVESFLMLQSCPVLYSLNLENAIQICCNNSKYVYAAALLPYLPKEKQKYYVKEITSVAEVGLNQLQELRNQGICITNAKTVLGLC